MTNQQTSRQTSNPHSNQQGMNMKYRALFIAALFACGTASGQEQATSPMAAPEPRKVDYLKCLSLMEKAAMSAATATSDVDRAHSLLDRTIAYKCVLELRVVARHPERLDAFMDVEEVWQVAVQTPSTLATATYSLAAQEFLMNFE